MPTLIEYTQAEVDRLVPMDAAARTDLANAQAEVVAARETYKTRVQVTADAEAALAAVRRALGGSEVPSHADSGGDALRDALVAVRVARGASLAAKLQLDKAERTLVLARDRLGSFSASLRRAQTEQAEAQAFDVRRQQWTADLGAGGVLEGIPGEANAIRSDSVYLDAQDKIENHAFAVPSGLRARLEEQLDLLLARDDGDATLVQQLESQNDALLEATKGRPGAVVPLRRVFERAEAAVVDFVRDARRSLDEARTRLQRIGFRPALTETEWDALASTPERTTELTAQATYDQAIAARAEAQRNLDLRVATIFATTTYDDAIAAAWGVGGGVPGDAAVTTHLAEIAAANSVITDYEATGNPEVMHAWLAEIPEAVYSDLLDFKLADRILDRLTVMGLPASLLSALTAAEDALVTALEAERDIERRLEPIETLLHRVGAVADANAQHRDERRRAALQGLR